MVEKHSNLSALAANPQEYNELAQLLKAAGDCLRLDVLRVLRTDSFGVLELCQLFESKQSGMSHHLKVLAKAGLLDSRREGNSIFYRRATASGTNAGVKAAIFADIDATEETESLKKSKQAIYRQRSQASQLFFQDNAKRFKEQQDLIAAFDVYGPQVADLLQTSPMPHRDLALEVGPGTGEFLPRLAKQFTQVEALDNSAHMLKQAQHFCQQRQLTNIDFQHGDTSNLAAGKYTYDCVVINMVLHHTPSPAQVFADVCAALKPGGILLLSELCQHDQDWARDACGDQWLGFDPADISQWGNDNGMREGQDMYFALRNGFQIQLRQFFK